MPVRPVEGRTIRKVAYPLQSKENLPAVGLSPLQIKIPVELQVREILRPQFVLVPPFQELQALVVYDLEYKLFFPAFGRGEDGHGEFCANSRCDRAKSHCFKD